MKVKVSDSIICLLLRRYDTKANGYLDEEDFTSMFYGSSRSEPMSPASAPNLSKFLYLLLKTEKEAEKIRQRLPGDKYAMFHFLDPKGKGQVGLAELNTSLGSLGLTLNSRDTELLL